jgi:hypothetical protein
VNWFSKQSTIALAFSDGWNLRPNGPCILVSGLGRTLLRRDSQWAKEPEVWLQCYLLLFPTVQVPFYGVIRLIDFMTQLTAVLQAGSLVSWHNFRSLRFCFNSRSRPGSSLFMSESVTLLVVSLYTEAYIQKPI